MSEELKRIERVEACIGGVMHRYPTDSKDYYVEVHQHLAPLARQLERELDKARAIIADLRAQLAQAQQVERGDA